MLKVVNKQAKIICDTCSKLSIGTKNIVIYFHFEQFSAIHVVSLLLTFNKYRALAVYVFQEVNFIIQYK